VKNSLGSGERLMVVGCFELRPTTAAEGAEVAEKGKSVCLKVLWLVEENRERVMCLRFWGTVAGF
jgi:hypothetical protein